MPMNNYKDSSTKPENKVRKVCSETLLHARERTLKIQIKTKKKKSRSKQKFSYK